MRRRKHEVDVGDSELDLQELHDDGEDCTVLKVVGSSYSS